MTEPITPNADEDEKILPASMDPASKSLADALRASFRLLTVIMIGVLVMFLGTGLTCIKSNENGVIVVFGRVTGVVGDGLTYNWPFPIGWVERVKMGERSLRVYDFWMHETAEDKDKPLSERKASNKGLRPGWEGAFLTGDRNLLHMRLECNYAVTDPMVFRQFVREAYDAADPGTGELRRIDPAEEIVRSVVCSAAIRAAATRTADGLQRDKDREYFSRTVKGLANESLTVIVAGMRINSIRLPDATWPLDTLSAFAAAQRARSNADKRENAAKSKAEEQLRAVAGESYIQLVGRPWQPGDVIEGYEEEKDYDLIGQYAAARRNGNKKTSVLLLQKIDDVLANSAKGQAARIISEARTYETDIKQRVLGRVARFEGLLPEYRRSPQFTINRLWEDVRQEILNSPNVVKWYLAMGEQKTIIKINTPSEIVRQQSKEELQAKENSSQRP